MGKTAAESEAEVAETDINCIMGKLIVFTGNSSSRAEKGNEGGGQTTTLMAAPAPLEPTSTKDINKAQRMW